MPDFRNEFGQDSTKAKLNPAKHGVHFEIAARVFLDPLAVTIADEEHSESEVWWITLGMDVDGRCLLVVHTFERLIHSAGRIRLFPARPPTRPGLQNYEEEQPKLSLSF